MFKKSLQSEAGFTLLEILIALLVLSIGLLGVASLQTRGQQFNTAAYLYTQATYLATDIMDRMRDNYDMASRSGGLNRDELSAAYTKNLKSDACPAEKKCDDTIGCTALELAEHNLNQWCESLNALPEGEADIVSENFPVELPGLDDPLILTRYTIIIKWWGVSRGSDAENEVKKEQRWLMIQ